MAKAFTQFSMLQCELNIGLQPALLAAAIVAPALVAVGKHLLTAQQRGNAIGELDLATHTARLGFDLMKDARGQDIAPGHTQA